MAKITISIEEHLMPELARAARDEGATDADLAGRWIERLLHARLGGVEVPHFARRLGPLSFPADDKSAPAGGDEPAASTPAT